MTWRHLVVITKRIFWILILLVWFSGCSTIKYKKLDFDDRLPSGVERNRHIRVTTMSGETVEGTVRHSSEDEIIIQSREGGVDRYHTIELDRIDTLELGDESQVTQVLLFVGLAVGAAFLMIPNHGDPPQIPNIPEGGDR